MPHDDFDTDETEIVRKPAMPKGEWILGMCGIGAILLFGFGLGVSLGQNKAEPKTKVVTEVANVEPSKPTLPEAEPTKPKAEATKPKAEPTKPKAEPTKPKTEPTKPKTEPTKPKTEPTKPAPPKPPGPMVTPVLFAEKISAIFKVKCNGCHGDGSVKGNFDMRTLASIAKGGDNGVGTAVVAKELEKSYLWSQINDGAMPPAGKEKLTAAEIKLIKDWILSGAK